MKKLRPAQKAKIIRLEKRKMRKLQKRKKPAQQQRIIQYIFTKTNFLLHKPQTNKKNTLFEILPPAVFSLSENYEKVAALIYEIRSRINKARQNKRTPNLTYVDFSRIEQLGTTAALLLAAEFDRWQTVVGRKLMAYNVTEWSPNVRNNLISLGFFDLLETTNPPSEDTNTLHLSASDLNLIKFTSDAKVVGEATEYIKEAFQKLSQGFETVSSPYDEAVNYGGVVEAMTNVLHHAYPKEFMYGNETIKNRWWMTGSVNSKLKRGKVSFLDQGIGIPNSLPACGFWEQAKDFLSKRFGPHERDDAAHIQAAMEMSRSRTGSAERGHGLNDIRQFVEESNNGLLRIRSGRGEVTFRRGTGTRSVNHDIPILGTVIEWEVWQ